MGGVTEYLSRLPCWTCRSVCFVQRLAGRNQFQTTDHVVLPHLLNLYEVGVLRIALRQR